MDTAPIRVGITGCGSAARAHTARLGKIAGVEIVACADPDPEAAARLAESIGIGATRVFSDHATLLREVRPDVVAIFTPHLAHYRAAMDALQAGCHVFIEKPLSTNAQEAVDIVNLARGRSLTLGVGHQYRLLPTLREARSRLASGEIGRLRLVTALLAQPWLAAHGGTENSWRFDPKISGGGILADAGDHLIDALLWTTGGDPREVASVQTRVEPGLDVVTAAAIRLGDDLSATLAISGVSPNSLFEITFLGDAGTLRADDRRLTLDSAGGGRTELVFDPAAIDIDADFIDSIRRDRPPCCPGDEAVVTVRLLEAIARSAASGQIVRFG
ncbi:MAG: Gfo/Idh/MocA family oxidoreductase [Isosphaeraceae bacterium]|nr:Gfo/Idh/MocA family oxidoreductase [Isosphaeraceae bacterium]